MVVSWNRGTSKSSILMGCSIINQPFWGTPIYGSPHISQKRVTQRCQWTIWDGFVVRLGRRDYVTGEMWKNKPPFRLCLNRAAADEILGQVDVNGCWKISWEGIQMQHHFVGFRSGLDPVAQTDPLDNTAGSFLWRAALAVCWNVPGSKDHLACQALHWSWCDEVLPNRRGPCKGHGSAFANARRRAPEALRGGQKAGLLAKGQMNLHVWVCPQKGYTGIPQKMTISMGTPINDRWIWGYPDFLTPINVGRKGSDP